MPRPNDRAISGGVNRERAHARIQATRSGGTRLLGAETLELLEAYGIPAAGTRFARTQPEALEAARELGWPLAMKIASPDIAHKSDVGGVRLGLRGEVELREAHAAMLTEVRARLPQARIEGVHLQRQIEGGAEALVGARRDPEFGPVVLFGLGGIYTEILKDVVFRLAPVSESDARSMIAELRAAAILSGARGRPPADIDAIVDCLVRVSQLMLDFPEIVELDINPLLAAPEGAIAVDARAVLTA